jgi:hypothetical protein
MKARREKAAKRLYGPTIQYSDGTLVPGEPLDVDRILAGFEQSGAEARRVFLCAFAHDLTVAIRALLFDRPVSDADLDRVQDLNESLHQLTSCANPQREWSAHDQALMIGAIIEGSFANGLDKWVGHALATASGTGFGASKTVAAT